jgi:hypothetical protein
LGVIDGGFGVEEVLLHRQLLSLLGGHLAPTAVGLMGDQADLHAHAPLLPQVLQPVSNVFEARPPRHVEHDEGAIGLAVVAACSEGYFMVMAR